MKKRIVFPLFSHCSPAARCGVRPQEALKQAATAVGDKELDVSTGAIRPAGTWTCLAWAVAVEARRPPRTSEPRCSSPPFRNSSPNSTWPRVSSRAAAPSHSTGRADSPPHSANRNSRAPTNTTPGATPSRYAPPTRAAGDQRRFRTRHPLRFDCNQGSHASPNLSSGEGRQQSGRLAGSRFGTAGQLQEPLHRIFVQEIARRPKGRNFRGSDDGFAANPSFFRYGCTAPSPHNSPGP